MDELWALLSGGDESSDDAITDDSKDDGTESNIFGPRRMMVRMMKRSAKENGRQNCTSRQELVKKDRGDVVRIV